MVSCRAGGCTKQACGFKDKIEEFAAAGFDVYGMSFDKPKSQVSCRARQLASRCAGCRLGLYQPAVMPCVKLCVSLIAVPTHYPHELKGLIKITNNRL